MASRIGVRGMNPNPTPSDPTAPGPTFDAIFNVMAAASVGNTEARVAVSDHPDVNDTATRMGLAVNVLLNDLGERTTSHHSQLETIQRQQEAILGLSVPVLVVEEDVLLLPVVGALDADRSARLIDNTLEAVHRTGAHVVLIDLTGVLTVDDVAAKGLVKVVRAAALLGATTLLCGITARVAGEIKATGADVCKLRMVSTLRAALAEARRGPVA